MLIPMIIAKKTDYFKLFLIATTSSALGGLLGYFLGSTFIDLAMNLVQPYGYEEKVINLKNNLTTGDGFYFFLGTLFLAGFTPLPFKVFTITSGLIGFNIIVFFLVCLFSRGIRFFIVSYLSYKFGNIFNNFMKKESTKWFTISGIVILLISLTIYFIIK